MNKVLIGFLLYIVARGRFATYRDLATIPANPEPATKDANKPSTDYSLPTLSLEFLK